MPLPKLLKIIPVSLTIVLTSSIFAFGGEKNGRNHSRSNDMTATTPESLGDLPISSDLEREISEAQSKIKALNSRAQTLQEIQNYQGYFERLRAHQSTLMPLLDVPHQTALQELLSEPSNAVDLSQLSQDSLDSELKRLQGKWPFLRIFLSIDAVHETFSEYLKNFRNALSLHNPVSNHGDFDRASNQRIRDFEREVIQVLSRETNLLEKATTDKLYLDRSEEELRRRTSGSEFGLTVISGAALDPIKIPLLAKWFALNILLRTRNLADSKSPASPFITANIVSAITLLLSGIGGGLTDSHALFLATAGGSAAVSVASDFISKKWGAQVEQWQLKRQYAKRIRGLDKDLEKILSHACAILLGR